MYSESRLWDASGPGILVYYIPCLISVVQLTGPGDRNMRAN